MTALGRLARTESLRQAGLRRADLRSAAEPQKAAAQRQALCQASKAERGGNGNDNDKCVFLGEDLVLFP